jgi:hypothetical protein
MRFKRFVFYSSKRYLVFFSVLCVLLAAGAYVYAGKSSSRAINEEMQHRETVLVRTGAKLIGKVFSGVADDLVAIAASPDLKSAGDSPAQRALLTTLLTHGKGLVVDVERVNEKGMIVSGGESDENFPSVADRDYFVWAKDIDNKGQVFYSQTLQFPGGPYQGRRVILLATPVWDNSKFLGTLSALISTEKLSSEYIQSLYITENSGVFLMGPDGYVYAAKFESRIGLSSLDYANQYKWEGYQSFVAVINNVMAGLDGKGSYNYRNPNTGKVEERLVAYTPVNKQFSLLVSVPVSDTNPNNGIFYSRQIEAFAVFVLIIICYALLSIYILTREERESFERGFRLGKERGKNGRDD